MNYLELSQKDLHDLAKGWYIGKHINKMLREGKDVEKEHLELFKEFQMSKSTSLSPNVSKFIVVKHEKDAIEFDEYLTKDNPRLLRLDILTFENMTKGLEIDELKDEDKVFNQAGRFIQRVAKVVHNYFLTIEDFSIYKNYFGILEEKKEEIFTMSLNYHLKYNDPLFSFSFFVPFIERCIQQLVFQYKIFQLEKDKKEINLKYIEEELIPGKLSELLDCKDLVFLFGKDICFLLRLLIGPLNSVNLRNVSIHGFMSQSEWYQGYTSLIFMIMFSLGPIAESIRKQYPIQAKMRPMFEECIGNYKKELIKEKEIDIDKIIEVFERSTFVLPLWMNEWKMALINYQKGEYYHCCVRLFPIIEHAIRRIYVCANNCAERLLTAEQKSLYTTLDILLVEDMMFDTNKKTKNLIFEELDVIFQNAIFDMFLWNECPRLRDMLSHGGINPFELKRELADWVLSLGLGLIVKYDIFNTDDEKYYESLPSTLKEAYLFFLDKYEPTYHPKSTAERIVEETKSFIQNYQNKIEFPEILDDKYKLHVKEVENETNLVLKCISEIKILDLPTEKKLRKNDYSCKKRKQIFYGVIQTEKEYREAVKIREVMTYCLESLQALDQSYASIYKIISDRKSTTQNRKHLSHIITYSPSFSEFFKLVSQICEYEVFIQNDDPDFVNKLYNVTGSIHGCIKKNMYRNGFEVLTSFIIPPKNVFDVKYIVVHKKFVEKSFGDFQSYKFVKK